MASKALANHKRIGLHGYEVFTHNEGELEMPVDVLEDNPDRDRSRVLGMVDDRGRVYDLNGVVGSVACGDPLDPYGSAAIYIITDEGIANHVATIHSESGDVVVRDTFGGFGNVVANSDGLGNNIYSVPGDGLIGQPVAWIEPRVPLEWDDPDVQRSLLYRGGAALFYLLDEDLLDN